MAFSEFFKTRRNIIIPSIALLLILVIVIVAVALSGKKQDPAPVDEDYINVTVETEPAAFFKLTKDGYTVNEIDVLNKTDSDLTNGIADLLPFKQSAVVYIKNLLVSKKIGTPDNNTVLLTVESRDEKDYEEICKQFKEALHEAGSDAQVYSLYIKIKSEEVQKLADDNGTSYAKAYLCQTIASQSDNLSEQELIKLSIPEIINSIFKQSGGKDAQDVMDDMNEEQNKIIIEDNKIVNPPKKNNTSKKADNKTESKKSDDKKTNSSAKTDSTVSKDTSATPESTVSEDSQSTDSTAAEPESTEPESQATQSETSSKRTNSTKYTISKDDESGWLPGLW